MRNRATPHLVPDENPEPSAETDDASSPRVPILFFKASGFFFCETMFFRARGERNALTDAPRYPAVMLLVLSRLVLKGGFSGVRRGGPRGGADRRVQRRGRAAARRARRRRVGELRHRAPRLGNRNSGGDLGDGHLGCLRFARGDGGTARCDARPAGCAVRAKRRARARERRARGGAGGGDARRRGGARRRVARVVRRGDGARATELVESLEHQIEALRVEMDEERVTGG